MAGAVALGEGDGSPTLAVIADGFEREVLDRDLDGPGGGALSAGRARGGPGRCLGALAGALVSGALAGALVAGALVSGTLAAGVVVDPEPPQAARARLRTADRPMTESIRRDKTGSSP